MRVRESGCGLFVVVRFTDVEEGRDPLRGADLVGHVVLIGKVTKGSARLSKGTVMSPAVAELDQGFNALGISHGVDVWLAIESEREERGGARFKEMIVVDLAHQFHHQLIHVLLCHLPYQVL